MANTKRPADPRSTEEILREMEELSKSIDQTLSEVSGPAESSHPASPSSAASAQHGKGGAFKSLLNFFVSVESEEGAPASGSVAGGETASATSSTNQSPSAAGPRVKDLVAGEEHPTFDVPDDAAGAAAGDLSRKAFEEIYMEAGVADSPCSVEELAKLLENPAISNQPMSVKIVAVNLTLSAKGVGVDVPVADAVRRDRALDAYQSMLAERARATEERNAELIQQLTKEAEEYLKRKQVEMETLRAETAEANRQSVDFAMRREAEEKRLADLISPFLEGRPSPVTVGNKASETKP
ncbi:MAG: hypothetical protein H0T45_00130 [Pyrinomonadaceae bacterium]|nr:hypothetical protein [Pyrinomonadaceae bacterium]